MAYIFFISNHFNFDQNLTKTTLPKEFVNEVWLKVGNMNKFTLENDGVDYYYYYYASKEANPMVRQLEK